MSKVTIYTDGGCRDNQNKDKSNVVGGWGVVLEFIDDKGNKKTKELYGGQRGNTTNNIMELTAFLNALKAMKRYDLPTEIITDSNYTVKTVNEWMEGWKRKGWRKADNKPIANRDLVVEIYEYYHKFKNIKVSWTKGHDTNPGNIRADELANLGMDEA